MASNNNEPYQEDQNSTSSSSKTGEVIATNQDLTTQILLRLPATLVANSKLVSKQWLSIISDRSFIQSHSLNHPPLPSGLFLGRPRSLNPHEYVPIDQTNDGPTPFVGVLNSLGLNILQSCNGLLLCSSSDTSFYICNPSTLHRKNLDLPRGAYPGSDFALNLAFDPKTSTHYKVICVRRLLGQQSRYQIEACSSETGLWKTVGEPFTEHDVIDFKRGVYCKGAVHWLKTTSNVLYFDIDEEIVKSTPEPPPHRLNTFRTHEYFGQSNGQLYFVVKKPLHSFTLLQMEDDYSCWSVKYLIDLSGLAANHPSMARNYHNTPLFDRHYECNVLCIANNGNEEREEIVLSMPGEIVSLDPYSNASKKIADLVLRPYDGSVWYKDFIAHEYNQSLFPV